MTNNNNFDTTNKEFRVHWNMGREAARNAAIKLNELVRILHDENPDWTISKIANQIWVKNEELDGFTRKTIYNNLDEENRQLIDTRFQKGNNVLEESDVSLHPNVTEQSSINDKEQQYQPSSELEKFRQEHGTEEEEQEQEQQEPQTIIDPQLLDRKVEEIARLEQENDDLKDLIQNIKKERVEASMSKSYTSEYPLEFSDEDLHAIKNNAGVCPLIVTSYPEKKHNTVRFDRSGLNKKKK